MNFVSIGRENRNGGSSYNFSYVTGITSKVEHSRKLTYKKKETQVIVKDKFYVGECLTSTVFGVVPGTDLPGQTSTDEGRRRGEYGEDKGLSIDGRRKRKGRG